MRQRPAEIGRAVKAIRAAAILLAVWLTACSIPPYPRGNLESLYPNPPRPQVLRVPVAGRALQVATVDGRADATPLVFVHGSPGDWKAWARYLDDPALDAFGPRYAFDRPGFGGSGPGQVVTDLREQARLLSAAMRELPLRRPAVLVGHSLGGPLIAWMAIDDPEAVCAAVMIAGSVSSQREAPRWYNRIADTALVRVLLPAELQWSNQEMLPLQQQLTHLEEAWPRLTRPLLAIQGSHDELVDPRTVDDLAAQLNPPWLSTQRVPDQGHFVLWEDQATIVAAINRMRCD